MNLLAALNWDPQIRGFLIVITAFTILPGSVYLLLATNVGAKLGFLLAAAGLTGWMAAMGWVWVAYGIGIKGHVPTWEVKEIVTGNDVGKAGTGPELDTFPKGWKVLKPGDPVLSDATATSDKVLAPNTAPPKPGEAEPVAKFQPPFDKLTDYTLVGGFTTGGQNYWIPGGGISMETSKGNYEHGPINKIIQRLKRGPLHAPHYTIVQVRPVIPQPDLGGTPAKPAPDPTKPITSVVMVRNQGDLRLPNIGVAISMTIVFGLIANALHRRDKQIMALRSAPATA
jgi:hypothetical protein